MNKDLFVSSPATMFNFDHAFTVAREILSWPTADLFEMYTKHFRDYANNVLYVVLLNKNPGHPPCAVYLSYNKDKDAIFTVTNPPENGRIAWWLGMEVGRLGTSAYEQSAEIQRVEDGLSEIEDRYSQAVESEKLQWSFIHALIAKRQPSVIYVGAKQKQEVGV